MLCPSCKHENRADRKFCVRCGVGLELVCPSCGTRSEPGERFCGECGSEVQVSRVGSRVSIPINADPTPHTEDPGERRQLTVMFCDLVGSTALSEQLDPEELREVVRPIKQTCAAVIAAL